MPSLFRNSWPDPVSQEIGSQYESCTTAHDINPASPNIYYTAIAPVVLVYKVMQDFLHQQWLCFRFVGLEGSGNLDADMQQLIPPWLPRALLVLVPTGLEPLSPTKHCSSWYERE